jgi:hypothetical protein
MQPLQTPGLGPGVDSNWARQQTKGPLAPVPPAGATRLIRPPSGRFRRRSGNLERAPSARDHLTPSERRSLRHVPRRRAGRGSSAPSSTKHRLGMDAPQRLPTRRLGAMRRRQLADLEWGVSRMVRRPRALPTAGGGGTFAGRRAARAVCLSQPAAATPTFRVSIVCAAPAPQ